jgi:hypothetical protein
MQPNPGDTTNALMVLLIKIIADGHDDVNISDISSSTTYSSSTVWTQALAYASLGFSILAAFGAVMGKQWLNSYKTGRGRGTLEERGMQRQRKLDGLEYWQLQTVLKAFLVLLQMSLLLFGLSLGAYMWTQKTTISSLIIFITASGILFYMVTILVSVLRPGSPFQTPGSELVGALCKRFIPPFTENIFLKSSAIRWLLETSTNPECVEAAAAMVPLAQWPPKLDALAMYTRFRENLMACRNQSELSVTYVKAMAHLCVQSVIPDLYHFLGNLDRWDGSTRLIHDAFEAGRLAWNQFKMTEKVVDQPKHYADARTALRTMVVHGLGYRLLLPDYEGVIWHGDLQWRHTDGRTPRCEEFDWLVDYLAFKVYREIDDEIQGDALLALSAMRGLGSSAKRHTYVKVLIRCMGSTRPSRVRYAALRAISDAREELASITDNSMPHGVDSELLDELSSALLTAVRPNDDRTIDDDAKLSFLRDRAFCYLTLIFTLAKTQDWHKRLSRDPHLKQCIDLIDEASPSR